MGSVKTIYLSLGSNLGDRQANLQSALAALEANRVRVLQQSSLYETAPRDVVDQPWFLNMAVRAETSLLPLQLLSTLQRIERELGRNRLLYIPRGPRTIDIDLLLFGRATIDAAALTVPHPRMLERRFVLEPLVEIAPNLRHPATKQLLKTYLPKMQDQQLRRAVMPNPREP